ncbi:hypothetical protein R1flu_003444 [Riccia fluitans]|uniref:DNA topoisomerase I n=1 Tax=Riccia fluitans TaxID=41844 RepID=A0ABD1YCR1_9MARC
MASNSSAVVQRKGHSLDPGGPGSKLQMDHLGTSERYSNSSRIMEEEDEEDEQPLRIIRSVRRGDGGGGSTSAAGSSRGLNGSASSNGVKGGSAGVSGRKVEGDAGADKKRLLGELRAGSNVGSSGTPVTKKVKVGAGVESKKKEPDPDEDDDDVPLAQRINNAKKTPPNTSTASAAKKIQDTSKPEKADGLSNHSSSNGPASPPMSRATTPKEGQDKKTRPTTGNSVPECDDSDDDKPLSHRKSQVGSNGASKESKTVMKDAKDITAKKRPAGPSNPTSDRHLEKKLKVVPTGQSSSKPPGSHAPKSGSLQSPKSMVKKEVTSLEKGTHKKNHEGDDDDDDVPLAQRITSGSSKPAVQKKAAKVDKDSDGEDDDDVPLARRLAASTPVKPKAVTPLKKPLSSSGKSATKKVLELRKKSKKVTNVTSVTKKTTKTITPRKSNGNQVISGGAQKWTTLEHNGVIFPPAYQPHGVKMLYKGKPVDLTPEQEEVATMFAVMKDTDYATKTKFIENFWNDWKPILGAKHVIRDFEGCDFTPIYNWHMAEKEKKKSMTPEEKKRVKEEKLKVEEKYMWAVVDGVKEKVGNFRVEPPGLFRGRGEHPKMGKLKARIYPEHIVINVGEDAPVPECPMPGHKWKEVRHDNTVTWLAFWNDPINTKEFKYVFLAASSSLKGQSDMEKYEKARMLKDYIENIRSTYTRNFSSSDMAKRQIAVATYLIDRLALRAGNEKDEDEADTVGCCSLKVEHVTTVAPRSLQFDFLGKDSIRYFNTVEVEDQVYKAIKDFKKGKQNGQDLFDKLDTSKLNAHLKDIMPGLTAKVFRTYNASITLDTLLQDTVGSNVIEKSADYQRANKEVAILCNHQRTISKSHSSQMEKLESKMAEAKQLLVDLKVDLDRARKGKPPLTDSEGKKRGGNPETLQKKIAQTEQRIEKMALDMSIKDDLKTVALGTSKINYMDPRITVAWCKRHDVPIEKVFNKSLLAKFSWAMNVEPEYRF